MFSAFRSVKIMPHCFNKVQRLIEDSSLHKTCCHYFSVQFLCHLAYCSLFYLFLFLKNGFLTATLPWRPFLMRLQYTIEGSAASLRSSVRSLKAFFLFLKAFIFRYSNLSKIVFFRPDTSSLVPHLSSFLSFLKERLPITLRYAKFSANSSLGIPGNVSS